MPKSSCLKWTYGRSSIDYRVALLFTRYLTAIGIIPESSKSYGRTDGRTDPICRKTSFLKTYCESADLRTSLQLWKSFAFNELLVIKVNKRSLHTDLSRHLKTNLIFDYQKYT